MTRLVRAAARVRCAAGVATLLFVGACSSPASVPPAATPGPAVTPAPSVSVAGASSAVAASPSAGASELKRITGSILGSPSLPAYTVDAPAGWSTTDGHFVVKNGSLIGVSVWEVIQVPSHPCQWKGHLVDVGPTVADVVRLLVAQPLRNATPPTDVTMAGYSGKFLQWSVPSDAVVTGDADFAGCDTWPDNGHHDFVSWLSSGGGERYHQVAGQVDRLWILDVAGRPLVVDATYPPNATAAERTELEKVALSLRFNT